MSSSNRRSSSLLVGQIIGQLAVIGVTPVLTRVYSPSEFSVYALAIAIAIIVEPLATRRIEVVLASQKTRIDLRELCRRALIGVFIVALFLCLASVLFRIAGQPSTADGLLGALFVLVASTLSSLDNGRLLRDGAYKRVGIRNGLGGLIVATLQLLFALSDLAAILLPVAVLVGRVLAIALTWTVRDRWLLTALLRSRPLTPGALLPTRRDVLSGLLSSTALYGATYVTALFFGPYLVGLVGTAQRLVSAPASLVMAGISQIYGAGLGNRIRNEQGSLRLFITGIQVRTAILVAPVMLCVFVFAPSVAPWLLGEDWRSLGQFASILAIPAGVYLVAAPPTGVLIMLGKSRTLLLIQSTRVGGFLIAAALAAWGFNIETVVIAVAVSEVASMIGLTIAIHRVAIAWDALH